MKTISIFILLLAVSISNILAQEKHKEFESNIEVVGTAIQDVVPNLIYIELTIIERYVNREKISIAAQELALIGGLRAVGIERENLRRRRIDADYQKVKKSKDMQTLLEHDYVLTVTKPELIKLLFEKFAELEVYNARIVKLSHTKVDSLRKIVRIQAIKSAKEKASYLTEAVGEKLGAALEIREIETTQVDVVSTGQRKTEAMANIVLPEIFSAERQDLDFQSIRIISSVLIRYQIQR